MVQFWPTQITWASKCAIVFLIAEAFAGLSEPGLEQMDAIHPHDKQH
ncbi:hypothetical protein [Synechococcus sp. UW179A]|nr:hypothetical protein [Synechococcus sp. UW179A]